MSERTTAAKRKQGLLAATLAVVCSALHGCAAEPAGPPMDDDLVEAPLPVVADDPWQLPDDVRAAGEAQYVGYDSAEECTGAMEPGAVELADYIVAHFDGGARWEGYNCRSIRGGSGLSMHSTGRAIDVYVPLKPGNVANNRLGDPIGNWLVENAEDIGMQYVVWDRTQVKMYESGRKDSYYGGEHPHHDHLHIELTHDGANRRTPWFTGDVMDCSTNGTCI